MMPPDTSCMVTCAPILTFDVPGPDSTAGGSGSMMQLSSLHGLQEAELVIVGASSLYQEALVVGAVSRIGGRPVPRRRDLCNDGKSLRPTSSWWRGSHLEYSIAIISFISICGCKKFSAVLRCS